MEDLRNEDHERHEKPETEKLKNMKEVKKMRNGDSRRLGPRLSILC